MKLPVDYLWGRARDWMTSSEKSFNAVDRWRAYSRFHGLWAPGVRLMRDLSLRGKATVIVACLLVPLLWLMVQVEQQAMHDWRESRQATNRLQDYQALRTLTLSMRAIVRATSRQELGLSHEEMGPLMSAHDENFQALVRSATESDHAANVDLEHLATRHQALIDALGPQGSATPALESPRFLAVQDYLNQLDMLREHLFDASRLDSHDDLATRTLFKGGVALLPRLSRALVRTTAEGARVLALDSPYRTETLQRLTAASVESGFLLSLLRPDLQRSVAQGLLDKDLLDKQFAEIQTQLKLAQQLSTQARTHTTAAALSTAMSLDVEAYARGLASATDASVVIEAAALDALRMGLAAHERKAIWRAVLGLVFPGLFFSLLMYFLFSAYKVLQGGLLAVTRNVEELARGNLGIRPSPLGKDESGRTLVELSVAAERMSRLFEAVTQGVGAVSQASREVAVGNGGLSDRTVEIREAITRVAAKALTFSSMMDDCGSELSNTVGHVRAMQVDAARSRKAMGGLRERMRALTGKSREISHVVQLMETVAFQTKLLALNASVEAARAGAAGKGFAVVAQEVRSLAVRSEESARRIHDILSSSISEIEECNLMTERASDAVRNTDEKIESVNRSMSDIVHQTQNGMNESQEVVRITKQVEESISGNARLVEQLSDASLALREQGESLRQSVHHFLAR